MNNKKSDILLGSLVADTYSLGSHWIYMQSELENSNLDWENLNAPLASFHKLKTKGDFTHYGDQTLWLYEHIKKEEKFDMHSYVKVWEKNMSSYEGYVDESSREALRNLSIPLALPCGGVTDELSVVARIAPLLLISSSKEEFVKNVRNFVLLTHFSEIIKEAAEFYSEVLWDVYLGEDIIKSIHKRKMPYSHRVKEYVIKGLGSKLDTFEAIRTFGPGCDAEDVFPGVIYLINKYGNDFKKIMIENAKAGGDTSSRAMLIAMLLVAANGKEIIPKNWINEMNIKI